MPQQPSAHTSSLPPHVVLVEDDENTRYVLESALAEDGFRVTACPTAESARATFRTQPAQLLVSDLRLRGSDRGGVDLIRELRKQAKEAPEAILLTGMSLPSLVHEKSELDAMGAHLVLKPFELNDFLALARELTGWPGVGLL